MTLQKLNKLNKLDLIYMVLKMPDSNIISSNISGRRNQSFKQQFQKTRSWCGNCKKCENQIGWVNWKDRTTVLGKCPVPKIEIEIVHMPRDCSHAMFCKDRGNGDKGISDLFWEWTKYSRLPNNLYVFISWVLGVCPTLLFRLVDELNQFAIHICGAVV